MKKILVMFIFCFSSFLNNELRAALNQDEYLYLDQIALKTGADKGSNYHNYTDIYSRYFADLKDAPIKFLEIGIFKGASVKLWEEYFKNADLHFIDISFQEAEYFSERSHYHICDQASEAALKRFVQEAGGDFDIIIDDGGHTMLQQIISFKTLFPHLKSGGMYIIEDLHTSYWSSHGGGGPHSTVNFLKSLVDEVNFIGAKTTRASHLNIPSSVQKDLNIYRESIYSIHFYDSVAIILKR
jgi:hypothetical protein